MINLENLVNTGNVLLQASNRFPDRHDHVSPHRATFRSHQTNSSLCNLCVLCVSVVNYWSESVNHRDTENTEVAQRNQYPFLRVNTPRNQVLTRYFQHAFPSSL